MQEKDIMFSILSEDTQDEAKKLFNEAIDLGVEFKLQRDVRSGSLENLMPQDFLEDLPEDGQSAEAVLAEFKQRFLPYSYNFASPHFMGFPDAGNSIAAISGNIMADFLQQNLINQSFCSPVGTFAEMAVVRWMREVVGYTNPATITDIFDTGGVITDPDRKSVV